MKKKKMIAFKYARRRFVKRKWLYPYNPNGALEDIAGITSENGKVLGIMPHPERALEF